MNVPVLRVYADTSVFGGAFDEEFEEASQAFFDQVRRGRFDLVASAVVQEEIESAPEVVQELFDEMLELAEIVDVSEAALQIQRILTQESLPPSGPQTRFMLPWLLWLAVL